MHIDHTSCVTTESHYSVLKGKTKELRDPLPPYNCRKDYYVVSLICDILCFITIIFGYSEFAVRINIHVYTGGKYM